MNSWNRAAIHRKTDGQSLKMPAAYDTLRVAPIELHEEEGYCTVYKTTEHNLCNIIVLLTRRNTTQYTLHSLASSWATVFFWCRPTRQHLLFVCIFFAATADTNDITGHRDMVLLRSKIVCQFLHNLSQNGHGFVSWSLQLSPRVESVGIHFFKYVLIGKTNRNWNMFRWNLPHARLVGGFWMFWKFGEKAKKKMSWKTNVVPYSVPLAPLVWTFEKRWEGPLRGQFLVLFVGPILVQKSR